MALITNGLPGAHIVKVTAEMIRDKYNLTPQDGPIGIVGTAHADADVSPTDCIPGDFLVVVATEGDEQRAVVGNLSLADPDVGIDPVHGLYAGAWPDLPSYIAGPADNQTYWRERAANAIVDHNGWLGFGEGATVFPAARNDGLTSWLIRSGDGQTIAEAGPLAVEGNNFSLGSLTLTPHGLLCPVSIRSEHPTKPGYTLLTTYITRWSGQAGWASVATVEMDSIDSLSWLPVAESGRGDPVVIQAPTQLFRAGDFLHLHVRQVYRYRNPTNPDLHVDEWGLRIWTINLTGDVLNSVAVAVEPGPGQPDTAADYVRLQQWGEVSFHAGDRFRMWFAGGPVLLRYERDATVAYAYPKSPPLAQPGDLGPAYISGYGEVSSAGWVDENGDLLVLSAGASVWDENGYWTWASKPKNNPDDPWETPVEDVGGFLTRYPMIGAPTTVRVWLREDLGIRLYPSPATAVAPTDALDPAVREGLGNGLLVAAAGDKRRWAVAVRPDGSTQIAYWCRERNPASMNLWNTYFGKPHLVAAPSGFGILPM